MDRIEFKMEPEIRDFRGALMKRLLRSQGFRRYLFAVISILIVLVVVAQIVDGSEYDNLLSIFGVGCVVALIAPFSFPRGLARHALKLWRRHGSMVFFLNGQGYGGESNILQFCIPWQGVTKICETERYIFIELRRGGCLTIFKRLLPDETLRSIREVIADAPVPKKELMR